MLLKKCFSSLTCICSNVKCVQNIKQKPKKFNTLHGAQLWFYFVNCTDRFGSSRMMKLINYITIKWITKI